MRHLFPSLLALATLCCAAIGCSGDSAETSNAPPQLVVDPQTIGQGQLTETILNPTDADGDAVTVEVVSPSPELVVSVEVDESASTTKLSCYASYQVAGPMSLAAHLTDGRGGVTDVDLPVEIAAIRWHETQTWTGDGPEGREHSALIVDEASGDVLLFGGSGYSPYLGPLDDMWRYQLATGTWTEVTPSGDLPSGGGSRRVAQVPGTAIAVLFGGYGDGGKDHNELYRLDISGAEPVFTKLTQQDPPSSRSLHAFFYDAPSDRFYAFGGISFKPSDELWQMEIQGDTAI